MKNHQRLWLPILFTMMLITQGLKADWEWANPLPQGNILADVAYSDALDLFIAVGNSGTILSSQNGINWTPQESGTNEWLEEVAWLGDRFVATGNGGAVTTSTDGRTWTNRSSGVTSYLYAVARGNDTRGNDIIVAAGSGGTIISSSDGGSTWTRDRTLSTQTVSWLNEIIWDGQQFIGVGAHGTIATGMPESWQVREAPVVFANRSLEGIDWNGDRENPVYLAVGAGDHALISTNGTTFTAHELPAEVLLTDVHWNGNGFTVVGNSGTVFTTAADGTGWQRVAHVDVGTAVDLEGVTSDGGTYVAVGDRGVMLSSSTGISWTPRSSGEYTDLESVTISGDGFLAVGGGRVLAGSLASEGIVERSSTAGATINDIARDGSTYVAVGRGGLIQTSTGGTNWSPPVSSPTANDLQGVAAGNGQFVAVGNGGTILIRPLDDTIWSPATRVPGSVAALYDVAFGNGIFVAVGEGGGVVTSSNGDDWTAVPSATDRDRPLHGVAFGNNLFVAVGDGGAVLTSANGSDWTAVDSGTGNDLRAVARNASSFTAVGVGGTILSSKDGREWAVQQATGNDLLGVAAEGESTVVVGRGGTILKSVCPCATDDVATTRRDRAVTINVLANDLGQGLSVSRVDARSHQGGTVVRNSNNTVTYTPPAGFTGTDSFEYTVTGNGGGTDVGSVTVHVGGSNGGSNGGGGGGSLGGWALLGIALLALRRRLR